MNRFPHLPVLAFATHGDFKVAANAALKINPTALFSAYILSEPLTKGFFDAEHNLAWEKDDQAMVDFVAKQLKSWYDCEAYDDEEAPRSRPKPRPMYTVRDYVLALTWAQEEAKRGVRGSVDAQVYINARDSAMNNTMAEARRTVQRY